MARWQDGRRTQEDIHNLRATILPVWTAVGRASLLKKKEDPTKDCVPLHNIIHSLGSSSLLPYRMVAPGGESAVYWPHTSRKLYVLGDSLA